MGLSVDVDVDVGRIWTAVIPFSAEAVREMGGGILSETVSWIVTGTEYGIGIGI